MQRTFVLRTFLSAVSFALIAVLAFVLGISRAGAQPDFSRDAGGKADEVELYQALLDLGNPWTVMCVAAHPDDEDGATLTLLRRKYGVHTVSLFSTYGEGGQNAIGPELYEELGAIRARETEEAAVIQGSEPYFLGLRDFGFSKSAEEAFRIWGHEEALRRMVLKIRQLRPDVIITNHDTVSGHGHHQATGRLVLEAFDAAADATRFPEQLRDGNTSAWQVQRIFVRVNYEGDGGNNSLEAAARKSGATVLIDPNQRDIVRGRTYAEEALRALQRHATQGPWPQTLGTAGARKILYRLAREAKVGNPLPSNAETVIEGLRLPEPIATRLIPPTVDGRALTEFTRQRDRVFDAIITWRIEHQIGTGLGRLEEPHLDLINRRIHRALAAAAGIRASLEPLHLPAVSNTSETFRLRLTNEGDRPANLIRASFKAWQDERQLAVPPNLPPGAKIDVTPAASVPGDNEINVPHSAHLYDGRLPGQLVTAVMDVQVHGELFSVTAFARIDIAPAVEILGVTPSPFVLTPGARAEPLNFSVRLTNHQAQQFSGLLAAGLKPQTAEELTVPLNLTPDETKTIMARINAFKDPRSEPPASAGGSYQNLNDRDISQKPATVSFKVLPHGRATTLTDHEVQVVYSDALVARGLRVGYVQSFDDTLRNALAALGVESKELAINDVRSADLKKFDTIIIDNRGYQAHPELVELNQRLLAYAREGGTLIVFYQKANEWNPDQKKNRPQLAPYPIMLGNERVTDETAPVAFDNPKSALLRIPNRISEDDFKDWIQERGLYYPKQWDSHYEAPLSMSDAGEPPLRGGLLQCDYGNGAYIYTSIVWYRQLRAGVPGAYRFFANMISYGHTKHK